MHLRAQNTFRRPTAAYSQRPAQARRANGEFLIEAVIAALVVGFITIGLLQLYVQVRKVGNMTQAQIIAASMTQEIIDNLRAQTWSNLTSTSGIGNHYPQVSGTGLGLSGDSLFPRPLLIDTSLDYTDDGDPTVSETSQDSFFQACDPDNPGSSKVTNTAKVVISQTNSSAPVTVEITICFPDSSGAIKTVQTTSVIASDGLNG